MSESSPRPGPVPATERIVALDVLRGFAVLGILLINIQAFSLVGAAYLNPSATQHFGGVDTLVWVVTFILADQKFMTIFSILFGAGIVLISRRAEATGRSAAKVHYSRQFWLLLIGMAHGYLLWSGDILYAYALAGAVAFLFRRRSPRTLLIVGALVLMVPFAINLMAGLTMPMWGEAEIESQRAEFWAPSAEAVEAEIAAYRGSWMEQMEVRVPATLGFQTFLFLIWAGWRAGGLMLIGMALFKLGILSAERADSFYSRMAGAGMVIGYPIVAYGVWSNLQAGFAFEWSMFLGSQFNYVGSIPVSLAYIGVVMLACRNSWLPGLQRRLAACGRMALSNYLLQTIIATFIFYGHGLGLFESLSRPYGHLVVLAIWIFQLWLSPWWLARYRFGPFEWLWRTATYLRPQPFRI